MLSGPVILLGAIGINGRMAGRIVNAPEFGPTNHERLLAYVEPVREAELATRSGFVAPKANIDPVADRWISDASQGKLLTVLPVDMDGPSSGSVLQDIREAKLSLSSCLLAQAAKAESPAIRTEEALRAIKVADIGKYSDFASVHEFDAIQSKGLEIVVAAAPTLDGPARAESLKVLSSLTPSAGKLALLVAYVRQLHAASLARKGQEALPIELSSGYGTLAEAAAGSEPQATALRAIAREGQADSDFVSLTALVRLAIRAEQRYESRLLAAKGLLQSLK